MKSPSNQPTPNGREVLEQLSEIGLAVRKVRDGFFVILNPNNIEGFKESVTVMLNADDNTLVEVTDTPDAEEINTEEVEAKAPQNLAPKKPQTQHATPPSTQAIAPQDNGSLARKLAKKRNVDVRQWAKENPQRALAFLSQNQDHPKARIVQEAIDQEQELKKLRDERQQLKKWVRDNPNQAIQAMLTKDISLSKIEEILRELITIEKEPLSPTDTDPIGEKRQHAQQVREKAKKRPLDFLNYLMAYDGPDRLYILEGVLASLKPSVRPKSIQSKELDEIKKWAQSPSTSPELGAEIVLRKPNDRFVPHIIQAFSEAGKPIDHLIKQRRQPQQADDTEHFNEQKPEQATANITESAQSENQFESEEDLIDAMRDWGKLPWAQKVIARYIQSKPWNGALKAIQSTLTNIGDTLFPYEEYEENEYDLNEPWFEDDKTE